MNYNPMYFNQFQQPQAPQTDDRIWVQNRVSAEAYLIAPNGFVRLWDSNEPVFYEKRADGTGRIFMEVYSYSRQTDPKPAQATNSMDEYMDKLTALEGRIEALESVKGKAKKEVIIND